MRFLPLAVASFALASFGPLAEARAAGAWLAQGAVTKIEWLSPHIYLYVAVKDDAGKETTWAVEGGAPNALYRQGWRPDTVKVNDVVTVDGWLARDGTNLLYLGSVSMGGRKLFSDTASQ